MNRPDTLSAAARLESLESRFALRVAARLTERSDAVPADISERLRFARERALERARKAATAPSVLGAGSGGAVMGGGWWFKLASFAPLVALVAGLVLISEWHNREQVAAAAEIDAALLADELPLKAYGDPGFVEYLKKQPD